MSDTTNNLARGFQEVLEDFEDHKLGVSDVWRHKDEVYFSLEDGHEYVIRPERVSE